VRWLLVLPAAVLLGTLARGVQSQEIAVSHSGTDKPPAPAVNLSDCEQCHGDLVTALKNTHHGTLSQSCAACHGDPTAHMAGFETKGEPGPIIRPAKLKPEEVNKTCLQCHDRSNQAHWGGGVHDRRGLSCISCHSVHNPKSEKHQLKTVTDTETCYTCHAPIRAKEFRQSHHPVREGLLSCVSCHDPHDGTRPKMIKANSTNEMCYTCHAEKRGPFVWEHPPVRENCALCHDVHGSNHNHLLVASAPFLCQRCHISTRHPSTLYDYPNSLAGPTSSISNRLVGSGCLNCHVNIHGSNAPSGPYLGR
jgi:DmsE family decaheme c-type cytochrome